MADPFLDAKELRSTTFVRHVELHETLGSTNDRAAELARDPSVELPALVVAQIQTAGKGRGGNKWWSAPGALTFSLLLDSQTIGISTRNWPQLSLATAVAVCDAVELRMADCRLRIDVQNSRARHRPAIKWPNDVYLEGRKVAGILIESPAVTASIKNRLFIGVGINVNNSWREAPPEIAPRGTALCDVTGTRHNAQATLIGALQAMQRRFEQLAHNDAQLPQAWQRLCWLTKQQVEIRSNHGRITGVCAGIDDEGALLVENVNGIHQIQRGSVQLL